MRVAHSLKTSLKVKKERGQPVPVYDLRFRCSSLAGAFVLATAFIAGAQSSNDSGAMDYQSFQVIVQRNIFNPDRYPQYVYHPGISRGVPTFSLAGTMSYRKGMFAFFTGTDSEYQEALQKGGTIAGYTVTKITFQGVRLEAGGKTIEMKVGEAMRQEEGGWQLSAPGEWNEMPSAGTESENLVSDETSTNSLSNAAPNDILKRLMQQREQELK